MRSGKLNGSEIKMFYGPCRASRRAVIRAKIELREALFVHEFSSISTMEIAWGGFPWGETIRTIYTQIMKCRGSHKQQRINDRSAIETFF